MKFKVEKYNGAGSKLETSTHDSFEEALSKCDVTGYSYDGAAHILYGIPLKGLPRVLAVFIGGRNVADIYSRP